MSLVQVQLGEPTRTPVSLTGVLFLCPGSGALLRLFAAQSAGNGENFAKKENLSCELPPPHLTFLSVHDKIDSTQHKHIL